MTNFIPAAICLGEFFQFVDSVPAELFEVSAKANSTICPLRFQCLQMIFRVKTDGFTAVNTFSDRSFKIRDTL